MNKGQHGMGRGLGALIGKKEPKAEGGQVQEIDLGLITANLNQPRTSFDEDALSELEGSIRRYGVIQPLILKKAGSGYEIIAGERRYRAAKNAGLKTVPAIIRSCSEVETTELALIENLQRQDLNIIEEAIAYQRLISEYSFRQEDVAEKIGKSRSYIANCLRLLKLPSQILDALKTGALTMGQARPLLALAEIDQQLLAAERIISSGLNARQAEQLVKVLNEGKQARQKKKPEKEFFISDAEDKLKMFFGTKVSITSGAKKNRIEIEYKDNAELNRILELLTQPPADPIEKKKELLRKFSQGFNV